MVSGTPSEIYDRVLPAITARLRSGTKAVRTDDPGVVVMRFSVPANDRSVRLVDVVLKKKDQPSTEVVVHAKKLSLVFAATRDDVDLSVETAILKLFKDPPNQPPTPPPALSQSNGPVLPPIIPDTRVV